MSGNAADVELGHTATFSKESSIRDANPPLPHQDRKSSLSIHRTDTDGIPSAGSAHLINQVTWRHRMQPWFRHLHGEACGIERVSPEARTNQRPRDMFTLFTSTNISIGSVAFGSLGPGLFGLGWWDSFLAILFFNILSAIPAAVIATFGPKYGLRTLVVNRFVFGWWPSKFIALLNAISMLGWAIVYIMIGASILYDVGQGALPLPVAALILGLISVIVSVIGYEWVHVYERYAWMVMLACVCVVAGFSAKHMSNIAMGSGASEISGILSFGTAIWALNTSWTPVSADFSVYMPEKTNPWRVFTCTYLGISVSAILLESLGAGMMTMVIANPVMADAYQSASIGGLIGQVFVGYGSGVRNLGYLIETVLALSVVSVAVADIYVFGLNIQLLDTRFIKIPRYIWNIGGGLAAIGVAIAGGNNLVVAMQNFLNIMAYWLTPWLTIFMLEFIIWAKGYTYNADAYMNPSTMPKGIAALTVFLISTILGVLSMSQTW